MQTKVTGWEYRNTVIAVDSYENSVPKGRIFNTFLKSDEPFEGVISLLKKLNSMMDEMNYPASYNILRGFSPVELVSENAEEVTGGEKATFSVKVIFRQNSSWQGTVAWLEGKREESFRSVLELLFLIDSALCGEV